MSHQSTRLVDKHFERKLANARRKAFGVAVRVRVACGETNRMEIEIESSGTLDQIQVDEVERKAHHFVLEWQTRIASVGVDWMQLVVVLEKQSDESLNAVNELFGLNGRDRTGYIA